MQSLTVRLEMVFDQVRKARNGLRTGRIIDVGSDHGYLAVRCLEEGIVDSAVCTEIHKAPAKRSEDALINAGYGDLSEVYVTDGLTGVPLKSGDIIVMAGIGGLNIIDIIKRAVTDNDSNVLSNVVFVVQPQKSNELVRRYLAESGFSYLEEAVCCDRNIFYNCIRVVYTGECRDLTDLEACYGPLLLERYKAGDKEVKEYFDHLDSIFEIRKRSNPAVRTALEEKRKNECI